ncbi:hypothetical protein CPL00364_CDS0006 [Klebsiella phage PoeticCupcake]|uniref:Uncharacterized protein n=1 Tax=Klebsiella phage vB_KpnP-VAC1 TaxID=2864360 RepID=A0AAE7XIX0_9CAUD|nr:hypothetical protein [Klebsiella phage vB_KpnP-VAC1]
MTLGNTLGYPIGHLRRYRSELSLHSRLTEG